ncbi:MAG: transposase family protein [Campylobacterota bacterium]|nr:transposase family protein [Campylobacterota bacterium]
MLGIIDSGSRALISLKHLLTKSTINIIRTLVDAIELYGKPQSIRTDNEMVFTSKLMRLVLWILGIKHKRTKIASP